MRASIARQAGAVAEAQLRSRAGGQMLNASNSTAAIPNTRTASATGSYSSQIRMILPTLPIVRPPIGAPTMATQLLAGKMVH
jgi:hypothetical protein